MLMTSKLRAVIFDFNGVIVDDEPLHLELFQRVMNEEGVNLSEETYRQKYLGYDDRGCFIAALTDAGYECQATDIGHVDRLIARKAVYYREAMRDGDLLFPGAVDLIWRLADRFPMAIASGALRDEIELVLGRGDLRGCFRVIIAAEDVSVCKPDPEGYIKALSMLNSLDPRQKFIQPDECLVIEDSIAGVEAAKRAGMRCLAVTNSYRAEELRGADWIIESLSDCDPQYLFKAL
jgi:beta-phosphoglucomutase-like phosphatase (HAD superfamily)